MVKIIYLPVPTPESRHQAAKWNTGRANKGKSPHHIIECRYTGAGKALKRAFKRGDLRSVGVADHVIILAHGIKEMRWKGDNSSPAFAVGTRRGVTNQGSNIMPKWEGGELKMYSPDELAAHLLAEGLNTNAQDLTLFSCGAGVTNLGGNHEAYASRLKTAMVALGYSQLMRLHAYEGDLNVNYGPRKMPRAGGPYTVNHGYTAEYHKGVYDAFLDDEVPASARKVTF